MPVRSADARSISTDQELWDGKGKGPGLSDQEEDGNVHRQDKLHATPLHYVLIVTKYRNSQAYCRCQCPDHLALLLGHSSHFRYPWTSSQWPGLLATYCWQSAR